MPAWSPILVQHIEIHALGFRLRRLQLNRHREAEVAAHRHEFAQLILYLSGEGRQLIAGRRWTARTGDLFLIPPRTDHGFAQVGRSRPVCLVLDYEMERTARPRVLHRQLPSEALNQLQSLLTRVPAKGPLNLVDYATILAVVARLLEHEPPGPVEREPPLIEKVQDLLRTPDALNQVSRQVGYHPDHLTRRLKEETGLGLRAHRDRLRLAAAQAALRSAATIGEAAARAGFDDANYFARWFRRQTGRTPSAWRG